MNFYSIPNCMPYSVFFSLYSSYIFIVLGIFILTIPNNPIPIWFGIIQTLVGIISTLHHMRPYEQYYNDIIQYIDIFLANVYGVCIVYLFKDIITIISLTLGAIFYTLIKFKKKYWHKSMIHLCMHMCIIVNIFYQIYRIELLNI